MAESRLEKVGTIYTRVCSLLKTGAMKEENKPFWINIYEAFPPKYEPCYSRPIVNAPIKKIFYSEDLIRAKFHKNHKNFSMVNLLDNNSISKTQQYLTIYKQLQIKGVSNDELYDKAVEEFLSNFKNKKEAENECIDSEPVQKSRKSLSIKRLLSDKEEEYAKKLANDSSDKSKLENTEKPKYKPIKFSIEKMLEDELIDSKQETKKSE